MASRKWHKAGTFKVGKPATFYKDKAGRARDKATGHFLSKDALRKRVARQAKATATLTVDYPESYRKTFETTQATEVTFRVKIPKALRGKEARSGAMVDAIKKVMRDYGHKARPRRRGDKTDRVRFFGFVEGNTLDLKTGKRIRGGTGIRWQSNLDNVSAELKDRIQSLYEGKTLARDPHKRSGSGAQVMPQGPDTVYVTAYYAPNEPIPFKVKGKKRISYL
jgi:hypothetical protein